jgi:hypothetical protein
MSSPRVTPRQREKCKTGATPGMVFPDSREKARMPRPERRSRSEERGPNLKVGDEWPKWLLHSTDGLKSVAMSGMENSGQEEETGDILIRE